MKKVSIFGATGSIGQNTIDLIARAPDAYDVVALTGARNIAQLAEDAQRLNAQLAVTAHEHLLDEPPGMLQRPVDASVEGPDHCAEPLRNQAQDRARMVGQSCPAIASD